jgi:hypothetical protein
MRDSSRESSVVAGVHEQTRPLAHWTRNWPAYNKALKRRGSLTIWFDPTMTWEAAPTGKRERQPDCSGEEEQKTVRGTVFPANAQARWHQAARSPLFPDQWRTRLAAQDPHRN